jgi:isoaspartyl peptidase/L-asparaginase-like protein (Ntn-hydrolase superfamily)
LSALLALHGGAGHVPTAETDPERFAATGRGLAEALDAGHRVLAGGGAALDAVVAAVVVLERHEIFNAGRGSVLTAAGDVEMGAAVMDGAARAAGAVAGVRRVAHPVEGALAVLRDGEHVLLAGAGAEAFAAERGLARIAPDAYVTAARRDELARLRARRSRPRESDAGSAGTVGAVARDDRGHLAAATSTGGRVGVRPGRIADSCLVGAGTWADDATCAVSGTGHGEAFIRAAFAHEADAGMRHADLDLETACERALASVRALGGSGGCVAISRHGPAALPFDTEGMPRAVIGVDGRAHVAIAPGDRL